MAQAPQECIRWGPTTEDVPDIHQFRYQDWARQHPERAKFYRLFEKTSKSKLYQAALHLAALATGQYDAAMADGDAERRLIDELKTLAEN